MKIGNRIKRKWCVCLLTLLFLGVFADISFAIAPPGPGELERYKRDGTLAGRIEFARKLGCHKFHPSLIQRKLLQKKILAGEGTVEDVLNLAQLPYETGLPSEGSPRIFVLLIEFPDHPHTQNAGLFTTKLFGGGDPNDAPYESLTNYYLRSSCTLLTIQGDAFGWYTAEHNRLHYSAIDNSGVVELIKEALDHFDPDVDFSQYDNNNDGVIDYFCIFWTGPDTGWGSLWWGWCDIYGTIFEDDDYTVDEKTLGVFSWQWECNAGEGQPVFTPLTVIHETGHAMGLPDFYDYKPAIGPKGGVGELDMMDGNWGDHNCFSKWMLDWLTPTIIGEEGTNQTLTLQPTGPTPDAVVIMPGASLTEPFAEYFMVQNRARQGNDLDIPTDGLLVWHVDATLNLAGTNFMYDNSVTEHKLLRLMEADGLEEIENNNPAEAGDFYTPGDTFSPTSIPNSHSYAGDDTGITVDSITSLANLVISAHFLLEPPRTNIIVSVPNGGETWYRGTTKTITWTYTGSVGNKVKIELLKGDQLYKVISLGTSVGTNGNGSYNWAIPPKTTTTKNKIIPGSNFKIRITSIFNPEIRDASDNNFSIR